MGFSHYQQFPLLMNGNRCCQENRRRDFTVTRETIRTSVRNPYYLRIVEFILSEFLLDVIVLRRHSRKQKCCHSEREQKDANCAQTSAARSTMTRQPTRAHSGSSVTS
jgi:hypothetical protein